LFFVNNPVPVKTPTILLFAIVCCISKTSFSQELDKSTTISLFAGLINYQGDLKPNSVTLSHSNFAQGLIIRKPINRWFTVRAGVTMGKIEASDSWNRDYLQSRNLSFTTDIKEAYAALEVSALDISTKRFTPYLYGGIAVFHFNPWTKDNSGVKTYLKPLSTEGQGLKEYPEQKPYNLTQLALPFGAGLRFAITDEVSIGIEFSQRKSFTDYIDDVSTHYVDKNTLFNAKGAKAVELAYRGGQSPVGQPLYPPHGEQRGTPSEMDWYYFFGLNLEVKMNALGGLFHHGGSVASQRCPRNVNHW
jgi:Domain of unknown function (DUF6089)